MKSVLTTLSVLAGVLLSFGCATHPRAISTLPDGARRGYAEFYVVPTYAESVVFRDGFEVLIAHIEQGKTNRLGKTTGYMLAGDRFRVACPLGVNTFLLQPRAVGKGSNNQGEHAWMPVAADIRDNMVTPIRAKIAVTATDPNAMRNVSKGLLGGTMGGIAAGVGAGIAGTMKGCVYEMRVDSGLPQPYYKKPYTTTWLRCKYGVAVIEACEEEQANAMKDKLSRIAPGLDLKRESDQMEFLRRYGIDSNRVNPNGCVVRIAKKDGFTKWISLAFDE